MVVLLVNLPVVVHSETCAPLGLKFVLKTVDESWLRYNKRRDLLTTNSKKSPARLP